MRRTEQVAPLREHAEQGVAGILQTAVIRAHRERHVAGDRRHVQAIKQSHQIGIGSLVEDDEPGIDGYRLAGLPPRHLDRVGMAADAAVLLVHHDVVMLVQQPGGTHAGNPGTDHGESHRPAPLRPNG